MRITAFSTDQSKRYTLDISNLPISGPVSIENNVKAHTDSWLVLFEGFTDLQVNGYQGYDMSNPDLTEADAEKFSNQLLSLGVTQFLPTLTTNSFPGHLAGLKNLVKLSDAAPLFARMMGGIHLEGPYISPNDGPRGAHPRQYCRAPDLDEFNQLQQASGGRIKLLTLSPEYENAESFISKVASMGVVVSIGHTSASPEQIRGAVDAGATMSTHLGNGMHTELARHPNYLWEQLAADSLNAGLIADGSHLPAATLKSFVRCKTPDRCFLVSDTTCLSGMPEGRYSDSVLGDVEVTEDRRLVIAGQRTLNAGAYKPLIETIPLAVRDAEISYPQAMTMASTLPKSLIGKTNDDGTLVVARVNQRFEMKVALVILDGCLRYRDPALIDPAPATGE